MQKALCISLFGVGDVKQLKLKLFQAFLPKVDPKFEAIARTSAGVFKAARRIAESLHPGFSSLDEFAVMTLPQTMCGRFIVLDDIERRREELSIDEVLGFIDEFTQLHGARFLLILNTERLIDREVWDTFREKVIDTELRLITFASECFGIASQGHPVVFVKEVQDVLEKCKVTNIRVTRKVIKAVNAILKGHEDISPAVRPRTLPSIVLLAAIAYKRIEDGPDQSFVLSRGARGTQSAREAQVRADQTEKQAKEEKRRAAWALLLDELGIYLADEFEDLVADFLDSGLFDSAALSQLIGRFAEERDRMETRDEAQQLITRLIWDHQAPNAELDDQARRLIKRAKWLDAYTVSAISMKLSEFDGLGEIAEEMVDTYLVEFEEKPVDGSIQDDSFNRPLHAKIAAAYAEHNIVYD